MTESESKRSYSEKGLFAERHKPILQCWVDGLITIDEMVSSTGKSKQRVGQLRQEVTSVMNIGAGNDSVAKAVSHAVIHGIVSFKEIDKIHPQDKLEEKEIAILSLMAAGFDDSQIGYLLSFSEDDTGKRKKDMLENLGIKSPYTAVAWGIRSVMRDRRA